MFDKRGLLAALAGAGLVLQACSSTPPAPPPAPVVTAPPPPDFTGTYAGMVTWPKGCHGPTKATLTVANNTYTLPWGKVSFTGPVNADGSFTGEIMAAPPPSKKHKAPERQAIDLTGVITPPNATGQVKLIKCVGTLNLAKAS